MRPFSIVAIYILFWVVAAFLVLPFGIRTHHDEDNAALNPGEAQSAPVNFRPGRVALRATVLATVGFGLFYANWQNGWVTLDMLSLVHPPAEFLASSKG